MSEERLPGIEGPRRMPDFSAGDDFLLQVQTGLRRQRRRRTVLASTASAAGALLLFVLSFSALERQIDEELWEAYLLSEVTQETDLYEVNDASWQLYLQSLLQEDDLDLLLEEILSLDGGQEWIQNIQLEG